VVHLLDIKRLVHEGSEYGRIIRKESVLQMPKREEGQEAKTMDEVNIEIFSRSRSNLMKIYEVLKCLTRAPLNMYQIGKCASVRVTDSPDRITILYLVSIGLLSKITPEEYMERGNYKRPSRKPGKTIQCYYEISDKGKNVVTHFETVLDLLGFREMRRRRFMG
jgi:hypothetical protein